MTSTEAVGEERPREAATEVTKSIRLKDIAVETQIQNAENLLDGTTNVYLPRKQEFVLDWIPPVNRRLGVPLQTQFWRLFKAVWQDEGLDSISRKSCARKHNLVPILLETLSAASGAGRDEQRDLMAALNDALEPLLKHTSEFKIRPFHEQGTVLLGTALSLVNNLPEADLRRDSFAMSFTTIFRGVLYRDRATKKLARAFFRNALRSTLTYLVHSRSENQTVLAVEYCLQQAIFSPDNLVDYINAIEAAERMKQDDIGFVALMTSLAASDTPSGSFDDVLCLPILLKLGLRALSRPRSNLSLYQKSFLASTFLSSLESFSSQSSSETTQSSETIIMLSSRHLRKTCGLLEVFHDAPQPSSDALTATFTTIATTSLSFLDFTEGSVSKLAWDALTRIMKIDFDIVLGMMEHLEPRLEVSTVEFFQCVISTNFKLRKGVEFIRRWTELLNAAGRKECALNQPTIISSYAPVVRTCLMSRISEEVQMNLASTQIQELLEFFIDNIDEQGTIIVMKTVLLGIKSPDIIEHITPFITASLAPAIKKRLLKGEKATNARFEIYYLVLELSDSLALQSFSYKELKTALRLCQKSHSIFALQCILRFMEVSPESIEAHKRISRAFRKGLESMVAQVKSEMKGESSDKECSFTILSALVRRWILLISERAEHSVRRDFVESIMALGAEYDYSLQHEGNNEFAARCAGLQYRFLISSDLYEKLGLIDPLMEAIIEILHRPGNVQSNGIVNSETTPANHLKPLRNVLAIISRIPLEPIPIPLRDSVSMELISLDRALIYGLIPQLTNEQATIEVLIVIRRALVRFIDVASKEVITDESIIDNIFNQFKSLDKFPSQQLKSVTLGIGAALLRRLTTSSSQRATQALESFVGSVVQKTSYELQNLRASLYSWSQLPNAEYFTPNGEALLAIVTIEELLCASNRPDRDVWKELEPLKNEAFVQLQGCLVDLLEAPNVEAGLSQGVFLLGKLGKLLMDVDTEFIVKDLNSRLANAFAVGMRVLSCSESRHQDLLLRSLEQIFCIMCYQPFESPLVLAAAYIALLRVGSTDVPTCGGSFARIISKLDLNDLDLLLQEIVATAIDEPAAVVVLEVTIRAAVMRLEDEGAKKSEIHFSLGKVLFNITRNILVTRSSDIFVSFLRLAGKFLREIPKSVSKWHLDHLIANLTIACSPAGPPLVGNASQDDIFDAIGSVALAMLQLHQKRLTLKYHLIVRMLQVMLHVFVRTSSTAPGRIRNQISRPPPWLHTSCSASSAALFSRILTMWATPPSTSTWHDSKRARHLPTSNAGKTGKAVSKHIPWFMMEYVALQAEYPELVIEESVQKTLAHGLYSLFNILGTFEREMCMGALDSAGRGIFKSLWEEWDQFGRFVEK